MIIYRNEWKSKFKKESRRLWNILDRVTNSAYTKSIEQEHSCCGFNNALDYCESE